MLSKCTSEEDSDVNVVVANGTTGRRGCQTALGRRAAPVVGGQWGGAELTTVAPVAKRRNERERETPYTTESAD
uniref:Uncharacterized protein n=1 Tax=Ascaris lumbricoides TaxID=6252 RepID=A0A0M3I3M1_ASCLU